MKLKLFRHKRKKCNYICDDGYECGLDSEHTKICQKYHDGCDGDNHISEKELDDGEKWGRDKSRPYHFEAGGELELSIVGKHWGRMVPLTLKFDDGDIIGQRVSAWVRPEDVWRFIKE